VARSASRPQDLEPSHAVKILRQLLTFVKNVRSWSAYRAWTAASLWVGVGALQYVIDLRRQ
jgi:hypothetical protein